MLKKFSSLIFVILFMAICQNAFGQTSGKEAQNKKVITDNPDDSSFYSEDFLKSDTKQVSVIAYVKVLSRKLSNQIGPGNCETGKGAGYCQYLLKAEVKEVFKGKIQTKTVEFYTTTEVEYKNKDWLLGERVVFLNQSNNYPDKKMHLGTLENSTREVKHNILEKLRKIAKVS